MIIESRKHSGRSRYSQQQFNGVRTIENRAFRPYVNKSSKIRIPPVGLAFFGLSIACNAFQIVADSSCFLHLENNILLVGMLCA